MTSELDSLRARLEQAERARDVAQSVGDAMTRIAQRINTRPRDMTGNLNEICAVAASLTDSAWGFVWLIDGRVLKIGGTSFDPQAYEAMGPAVQTQPLDGPWPVAVAAREGRSFAVDDYPAYMREHAPQEYARSGAHLATMGAQFAGAEQCPGKHARKRLRHAAQSCAGPTSSLPPRVDTSAPSLRSAPMRPT